MNKNELVELLRRGLSNGYIGPHLLSAIKLIEATPEISIDRECDSGISREELLDLYRFRHALYVKKRLTPPGGLTESIRSFAENRCDRVWLICIEGINVSDVHIIYIIVDGNDIPIGCIIGTARDQRESHHPA